MSEHANYPHEPGRLHGCRACEDSCHCTYGTAECVFEGTHIPSIYEGITPPWNVHHDPEQRRIILANAERAYMDGMVQSTGDVDTFGTHVYLVDSVLVFTDSQGFKTLQTYDTEPEAIEVFAECEREYAAWADA